jgi:large subunit ribosomal protein L1
MLQEDKFIKAVQELRKNSVQRKFTETVDLIVNLKGFDTRRESFTTFIQLPNKVKENRIAAFFEKDSKLVKTIKKDDFSRYKEKKDMKKLLKKFDFFIASAKVMPLVATNFGRVLGPAGKMPSPQLGILPNEDEVMISDLLKRIDQNVRIKVKEPSIKIGIAKSSISDEKIAENATAALQKIINSLPRKNDNIRNVKIKFTMSKPLVVDL